MAYDDYLKLFVHAQKNPNALYYVVSFGLANTPSENERIFLDSNILIIVKYVYKKILDKEVELKRQIMLKDKRLLKPWNPESNKCNEDFIEPRINGDSFSFTVLNNTVSREEIVSWVNECVRMLNMNYSFKVSDGYYETNEYEERDNKLYRGDCIQILDNYHKLHIQRKLNRIRKKLDKER